MHYHIPGPKGPIRCSSCGSARAIKPVNEPEVILRCDDCGHERREPSRDEKERFEKTFVSMMGKLERDDNPTF